MVDSQVIVRKSIASVSDSLQNDNNNEDKENYSIKKNININEYINSISDINNNTMPSKVLDTINKLTNSDYSINTISKKINVLELNSIGTENISSKRDTIVDFNTVESLPSKICKNTNNTKRGIENISNKIKEITNSFAPAVNNTLTKSALCSTADSIKSKNINSIHSKSFTERSLVFGTNTTNDLQSQKSTYNHIDINRNYDTISNNSINYISNTIKNQTINDDDNNNSNSSKKAQIVTQNISLISLQDSNLNTPVNNNSLTKNNLSSSSIKPLKVDDMVTIPTKSPKLIKQEQEQEQGLKKPQGRATTTAIETPNVINKKRKGGSFLSRLFCIRYFLRNNTIYVYLS